MAEDRPKIRPKDMARFVQEAYRAKIPREGRTPAEQEEHNRTQKIADTLNDAASDKDKTRLQFVQSQLAKWRRRFLGEKSL